MARLGCYISTAQVLYQVKGEAEGDSFAEGTARTESMRVNQYLAQQLEISRRRADALIAQGRVTVNNHPAEPGQQIDPAGDAIAVDRGTLMLRQIQGVTVALYKPRNVISSRVDPQGRRTVVSLLPPELSVLKPVGRLDYDSEGLLLLSNDGPFIHRMTHPPLRQSQGVPSAAGKAGTR